MNIVILGAGNIGSYLASILSQEEHNVIVIDKDPKKLEQISRLADVATLHGYGSKWMLLDDLIESKPEFFIALTGDDETNLVACSIAKNLGYPHTVARVKEIGYLAKSRIDFGRLFFVDHFIGAEVLAAYDLLKGIIHPGDLEIENFAHGAIQMRTIKISENWQKKDLSISTLDLPEEMIIGLIRRKTHKTLHKSKEEVIFPHGNDCILPGDEVTVIGERKAMEDLHKIFHAEEGNIQSVMIVGGSETGLRLANILEKMNIHVKMIEKDENKCKTLSDLLTKSTIINHDGANLNFLETEQVQKTQVLVACTHTDETNLLIALLGKQAGCKKVMALISDTTLGPLLRNLDIDFSISPKVNIANRILSLIHAEKIISLAPLCNNLARVLEIKVSEDSELVGLPIASLKERLPKDFLIAAIENRGKVMIGKGNKILSPNDTVIVITSPKHLPEIEDLF